MKSNAKRVLEMAAKELNMKQQDLVVVEYILRFGKRGKRCLASRGARRGREDGELHTKAVKGSI